MRYLKSTPKAWTFFMLLILPLIKDKSGRSLIYRHELTLGFRFVPINKSNNFDKTKAEVTYDARKVSSPIWRISPLLYC